MRSNLLSKHCHETSSSFHIGSVASTLLYGTDSVSDMVLAYKNCSISRSRMKEGIYSNKIVMMNEIIISILKFLKICINFAAEMYMVSMCT